MPNPTISVIKLPNGTLYDLKDAFARDKIETIESSLAGGVSLIGSTTTVLTDGATTNPITVNNKSYTAINGNMVYSGTKEFLFDGTKWIELGDIGSLGALAYKDSATGTVTPTGSVTSTFTGTEEDVDVTITSNASGNYQPSGSVSVETATTENKTATVSAAQSGTTTYEPAGTVSTPTISLATAGTTDTIHNPTAVQVADSIVTAAPGQTAPSNSVVYYSVSDEVLSLYQIGVSKTASITTSDVTVKTGDASYSSSTPTFSGEAVRLVTDNIPVPKTFNGTFTGDKVQIEGTTTPSGTITNTFTGNEATVTVE